jgi:hypothetical protein
VKSLLSLDFLVLFILTLSATRTRPYYDLKSWEEASSAVFLLMCYFLVDVFRYLWEGWFSRQMAAGLKWIITLTIIMLLVVSPMLVSMQVRRVSGPASEVHDAVVQTEIAASLVSSGKNPYGYDYRGTALAEWRKGQWNPALHHYAYSPLQFLITVPAKWLAEKLFGFFDQRMLNLLYFLLSLLILPWLVSGSAARLCLVSAFSLNPFFAPFLIAGRNDISMVFFIVASAGLMKYLDDRNAPGGRTFILGLASLLAVIALGLKHTAILFAPFLFFWAWKKYGFKNGLLPVLAVFLPAFAAVFLPFYLWDSRAFLGDLVGYQAGTVPESYPIKGPEAYGFAIFPLALGWVSSTRDYYPFWIHQFLFGVPAMLLCLWLQNRKNTASRALMGFGILYLVIAFFSRVCSDNILGGIFQVLLVAGMGMESDEKATGGKRR